MPTPTAPMRRLFRYLGTYRRSLAWSVGTSIVNKIFDLMPPFLTAWLIDTVSGQPPTWITSLGYDEPMPVVWFLIGLTVFIFAGESLFEFFFQRGFRRLAQRVQHDLRTDAYAHLQTREMAFFENRRTGNLLAILNDDINQLERFLNGAFNRILQIIVLVIFAGWSLCAVSWELGLISMASIPLIVWGSFYYQRRVAPLYRKVRGRVGELSNRLENNISGMPVIKSFGTEAFEAERVRHASAQYRDTNFRTIEYIARYVPLIRIIIAVGFAATLGIGAYWVLFEPGRFTVGNLAFFAMMTQRLLWPVTQLGALSDEFERARAASLRVFGLLDTPNRLVEPARPRALPSVRGELRLDGVQFAYQPEVPILRGIDLRIRAGETIGIAGVTGAGKTTLVKLLLRFYDPTAGAVRLEGIDLRELRSADIRRQFALVSQEVYLFHGTIRENIAYGSAELPPEAVVEAAKKAQLHGFIAQLPRGYDTIVGERGIKLSGGQRQRLSIARAILKDAPILLLDEATSAVDTETERAIQESLHALSRGKTAIIIAHRLSTIRRADRIVVLAGGRIAELGNHDRLLAEDGLYADLWRVQIGEPG